MNVQINSPFETTNLFWEVLLHVLLVILLLLLVKHLSTDRAVQHLIVMLNFDVGNLGEGSKQVTWVIVYPPQLLQCKWHSKQVTKEQNVYLSQMLLYIAQTKSKQQQQKRKKFTWARCCSTWISRSWPPAGKAASHHGQCTFSRSFRFFFSKILDLSIVRLLLVLIFRFRMLRLL